ncbi:MAG: lanthionine synthetase LanC family protein [Gemmatimonadales bacterium]
MTEPPSNRRSRREFLAASAFAASALTVQPDLLRRLSRTDDRPMLTLALRAARWIEKSTHREGAGLRWPADPRRPESVDFDFYNGMPGVVLFFALLHDATGDPHWLELARGGGDSLIAALDGGTLDAGLYIGLAGIGYTLDTLAAVGAKGPYREGADRAWREIVRRQNLAGLWGESYDIISGGAGTALGLLAAAKTRRDPTLVAAATRAGAALLAAGETDHGGLMWFPAGNFRRNYPNFSHGTAGVGYTLATLHQVTGEDRFLQGALAAARYLDGVATRANGTAKIFHQSGGGEERFYLSWCHGPVGTSRLFYRLHQITREKQWADWVDSLAGAVFASGIPEQRTPGFWSNISQCCGNVGVGQFCIDLARYRPSAGLAAFQQRVVTDTMRRATDDSNGLRWIQAENRTQPDNLMAQTGFMQGAAGVGTFLLQADALARNQSWGLSQPDTPFHRG